MKHLGTAILFMTLIVVSGRSQENEESTVIVDNFERILYNPTAHIGEEVIWGGSVIDASEVPGGAELMISEIPLEFLGEAEGPDLSRGRFIVRSQDTTLIERFKIDDLVIVTGKVEGSTSRPLGKDKQYTYPVISIEVIHPCYRAYGYGYRREGKDKLTKFEGPFCVDPETEEKHSPKDHHKYDK